MLNIPQDRLTIQVAPILPGESIDENSSLVNLPVSRIRSFLAEAYGSDVPLDTRAQDLTDGLMEHMSAYSLDPELTMDNASKDLKAFLPYWFHRTMPISSASVNLGDHLEVAMSGIEATDEPVDYDLQDAAYMISVHDLAQVVMTSILDIPHPAEDNLDLLAARAELVPEGHRMVTRGSGSFELLLKSPFVNERQRNQGQAMIETTQAQIVRSRSFNQRMAVVAKRLFD